MTENNSLRWTLALAGVLAFAVISPFFHFGQASGHDFEFHLESWMDVARQWHQGVVFPRWAAWANYGYGEPRFIFYPPASWILGAALGCLLPWWIVPSAFIVIAILLSSISMHRLARDWMPPGAAVFASIIYAANPYQLLNIYLRSDFAELLASAVFPLAVYFTLRCASADAAHGGAPPQTTGWRNSASLAVVYAAIWFSNAPAAVIASYALALLVTVRAISQRSLRPLLFGTAGLVGGLMLAAFYIIPAAYEQRWVNISQVLSDGLLPTQNFLFTAILSPEHNLFNINVSLIALIAIGLATIAAALFYLRLPSLGRLWSPIFALTAATILLMTPLSSIVWRYAPELRFIQFPWRFLTPLALCTALFLGQIVFYSGKPGAALMGVAAVLILTSLTIVFGPVSPPWWDSEGLPTIQSQVQSGAGYEGTDEYCVRGGDRYDLPESAPNGALLPIAGHVSIQEWKPERKTFTVNAPVAEHVTLRLMNYPAWKVRVNGEPVAGESSLGIGQLLVPVPAGPSLVEIHFAETPDRKVGAAVSVVGLFLLTIGVMIENKTRRTAAG